MSVSGVQKPALLPVPHVASCACSATGTNAVGRQCAPPHAGVHARERRNGSMSGGPVYGQGETRASTAGPASTGGASVAAARLAVDVARTGRHAGDRVGAGDAELVGVARALIV